MRWGSRISGSSSTIVSAASTAPAGHVDLETTRATTGAWAPGPAATYRLVEYLESAPVGR
jgi:hypothetical protein